MSFAAHEFRWPVHEGGYKWEEGNEDPLLLPLREEVPVLSKPLEGRSGLFRNFAETALEPKSERTKIVRFADRYGMLIGDQSPKMAASRNSSSGERLSLWQQAILELRLVVMLWLEWRTIVQPADVDEMTRRELRFNVEACRNELVAVYQASGSRSRLQPFPKDELEAITAKGQQSCDSKQSLFSSLVTSRLAGCVEARMSPDEKLHPSLQLAPKNLLTAMWLQLAFAIKNDTTFRSCGGCNEWFEPSKDPARTDQRVFCSVNCRNRDQRARKLKASELWKEGQTIQAIAVATLTPVHTLGRWLRGRSE